MGLFDKIKEKMEDSLMETTMKMDRAMTIQWAGNFKSGYESSNFEYMETCIDNLEEGQNSPFFPYCARGIFIIASAAKNPPMPNEDLVALLFVSSNIKKLNNENLSSLSAKEKELRRWYYQEFDSLIKKHGLANTLNWKM